MSKYKELWTHLKKVDGAKKLTPHACFYEKLNELMDYIEKLYDTRGKKSFRFLTKKS